MKHFVLMGSTVLCLGFALPGWVRTLYAVQSGPMQSLAFAPSSANIPNPERGFYHQFNPFWLGTQRQPLTLRNIGGFRAEGITMIRAYYVIDEFRDGPISTVALDGIAADLTTVRQAGLKLIPRFAYVFPCAGSSEPCSANASNAPDVPLERVLGHLDQLAPVLRANSDVIAFMEMGFVGPWGEWHSSSNGLVNPNNTANESSRAIIERVLWALPERRMAALRYPFVKQQLFGPTPLPPEEAFTGSPRSRLGFHNDCFLASTTSTINLNYQREVLDLWRQQGCFDEVQKRLGYRFRLVSAEVPTDVRAGGALSVTFTITNDGFAAPYNPRGALLMLRHAQSGRVFVIVVPEDPRRWAGGESRTVTLSGIVPSDAESGEYQVLLNFPDPEPTLYSRPEYSIRLANDGLWEEATGSNVLPARIGILR